MLCRHLNQEKDRGVNLDLKTVHCNKAVIEELVQCINENKHKSASSQNLAETVSFWLSYAHSKKVRMIFGRILLECLHDSQDTQIAFCEN